MKHILKFNHLEIYDALKAFYPKSIKETEYFVFMGYESDENFKFNLTLEVRKDDPECCDPG